MEMTRELDEKISSGSSITEEEANVFLSHCVEVIRKDVGIFSPKDIDCTKCIEACRDFAEVFLRRKINFADFNIKKQLNIPLTHYSLIVELNVVNKKTPYLIDITYNQFSKENYEDNIGNKISVIKKSKDSMQDIFSDELINNGYIKLDEQILKSYIDSFLNVYDNVDKLEVYKNISERLNKFSIDIPQSIENIQERKELLTIYRNQILEIINSKDAEIEQHKLGSK